MRRTSLDELPQLWSVLVGDMSLVGPRPALFNQDDLMALRNAAGVQVLRPGLTGWAQVHGRDELPVPDKARLDAEYLARRSTLMDLSIIARTAMTAFSGRGVRH
jgi:O-antigen biosynthesis protein WbqP